MKKKYSTPRIHFENFQLSQSIAAGCEFYSNHIYQVCPVTIDEGFILFTDLDVCGTTPSEGMGDVVCYDNPGDDSRVFTS